jgi:hypothetical protein
MSRTLLGALSAAVALLVASIASAQSSPWRLVQSSDGTLYLLAGSTRYVVTPDLISDDDLATLNDGGVLGSQLSMPTALVPNPGHSCRSFSVMRPAEAPNGGRSCPSAACRTARPSSTRRGEPGGCCR